MVNALARQGHGRLAQLTMPTENSLPRYILPAGYVDYRIVRGLFLELLKNCAIHGTRDQQSTVPVTVGMRLLPNQEMQRLVVTFTSPTIDKNWRPEDGIDVPSLGLERKSFLLRLRDFCRRAKWLSVMSSATNDGDGWRYNTELFLDAVRVRGENGAETFIVSPSEGDT